VMLRWGVNSECPPGTGRAFGQLSYLYCSSIPATGRPSGENSRRGSVDGVGAPHSFLAIFQVSLLSIDRQAFNRSPC